MASHPVVIIKQPDRKPLYLQVREKVEIGRECDGLLLDDLQCSRRHVALIPRNGMIVVEDLGSTNGTFVNGTLLTSSVLLAAGTAVRVGGTVIELAAEGEGTDAQSGAVRPAPVPGLRETSIELVARTVEKQRPDTPSIGQHEGTVTIVFSDIESSTEQATRLGDTAWIAVLNAHNAIIRRNLTRWGGNEVKNQGDGFMLTFPSARRALCCVAEVQQDLVRHAAANPEQAVRIRVGVHTGEVIVDDGDIFGKHVIIAARVANLATGGEILVSSLVWDITSARGDLEYGEPRSVTLKGIEGAWTVYPLIWENLEATV
ncbi:MAG: adenylate/guanylate cyclase domain-containing protein [Acidimicrobiia bacterium]